MADGIGDAFARALALRVPRVAVGDSIRGRRGSVVETIMAEEEGLGGPARTGRNRFGEVDIPVRQTGGPPPSEAADPPVEVGREQIEAIVIDVIASLADRSLASMRMRGWGKIIASTSSGRRRTDPEARVIERTPSVPRPVVETLAREVTTDAVTANVVAVGRIATDRVRALDEERAEREGIIDRAAVITVAMLRIDGGLIRRGRRSRW